MITYGHGQFIEQAVNSVLMQDCNFEIELILANDCSPDKTDEVINDVLKSHPRASIINYIRHEKNIGMMPNFIFALQQCKGKYIALCEGDDYWTDPLKLQKQVDFLEKNETYSICWTKYLVKRESQNLIPLEEPNWIPEVEKNKDISFDLNTIFTPYCTYTLTTLFRREILDFKLLKILKNSKDNTIYAMCLSRGKGMLMNFYSAVYRIHEGGIYSNASVFNQNYHSYLNLKEIASKIPYCNNYNIRNMRNYLLRESIKFHPNHLVVNFNLFLDTVLFLGIKESWRLTRKYKKHDR